MQFGYRIDHPTMAVKEALYRGQKLVTIAKNASQETQCRAKRLIAESKKLILQNKKGAKKWESAERRLWEVVYYENEISRVIRSYFNEVSSLMQELEKLNPPLRSAQLSPFLSDLLSDRRNTLTELEPLTKTIGQLQIIKNKIKLDDLNAQHSS